MGVGFYQGEIICDAPTAEAMVDEYVREFVIGQEYHPASRRRACLMQGRRKYWRGHTHFARCLSEVLLGSMCGLIGRTGAGKTTFMRAVMGALEAKTAVWNLTVKSPGSSCSPSRSFLLGSPEDRLPSMTAEENIFANVDDEVEVRKNGWPGFIS